MPLALALSNRTLGPRRRLPIEQRRAQVLDAALVLISDHGYPALSVEAIARQARGSKTVVYNAYGGLEPLLHALLDREETAALTSLAHAAPDSCIDRLRAPGAPTVPGSVRWLPRPGSDSHSC